MTPDPTTDAAPWRETCYRCRRPAAACLCPRGEPMDTRTRIVLLMHWKEWRREKCATGRLACLNLRNSEIIPGLGFDGDARVRALVEDPGNAPFLLYPGEGARDLSSDPLPPGALGDRNPVVFIVDATWSCSRAVLRASPGLLALPRLAFSPKERSRFRIKRQPGPSCLSTIEAIHELLLAMEASGLGAYPDKARLLDAFEAMQRFQEESEAARRNPRVRSRRGPAPEGGGILP